MNVLGFDLSTRQGSIALMSSPAHAPGTILAKCEWRNDRRNSAAFFRALNEIIKTHGSPRMIVVGIGPGSYTGTRIAISAAIGLHLTTEARVVGFPSICAMLSVRDFAVIGDAKRASFFFGRITQHRIAGEIELLSESEMSQRISRTTVPICTADDLPQFDRAQLRFPRAELLCHLILTHEDLARMPLEPIYLRAPHITSPKNK
jgi:tRNA threonylcarbamoyladenosine biosynthesis protein TsaB